MVMDNARGNFKQFIINMTMYYRVSSRNIQSRRNCRRPSSPQIKSCSFSPFLSSSSSAISKRVSRSSVVRARIYLLISCGPNFFGAFVSFRLNGLFDQGVKLVRLL